MRKLCNHFLQEQKELLSAGIDPAVGRELLDSNSFDILLLTLEHPKVIGRREWHRSNFLPVTIT